MPDSLCACAALTATFSQFRQTCFPRGAEHRSLKPPLTGAISIQDGNVRWDVVRPLERGQWYEMRELGG